MASCGPFLLLAHEVREGEWLLLALTVAEAQQLSVGLEFERLETSVSLTHLTSSWRAGIDKFVSHTQPVQYHKWSSPVGPVVWGGSASTS